MGREGPAHPGHRRRPLLALAVSLLLTCRPGLPFNAVVFAQTTDQGTLGAPRQLTPDPSSQASLISSVGTHKPRESSASPHGTSVRPTGSPLVEKSTIGPAAKTLASPASSVVGRTTQSLGVLFSALSESTSRGITHSKQRTSPSPSPQVNGTPSGNSFATSVVSGLSSPSTRTSSTEGNFTKEASTYTLTVETTKGPVTERYTAPTETSTTKGDSTGTPWNTRYIPAKITSLMKTFADSTASRESVPLSMTPAETTVTDPHTSGRTNPSFGTVSSSFLDLSSRGTPNSRAGTSLELTPSTTGYLFSSPEPGSPGHSRISTSAPLLSSASVFNNKISEASIFFGQSITSPMSPGMPEARTSAMPNSVIPFSMTLSNAETSAERIRDTISSLGTPSTSTEQTAESVLTSHAFTETTYIPSTHTTKTLASEWSGSPGALSGTSNSVLTTTSPSTTLVSGETDTHYSTHGKETEGNLNASMTPLETSAPGEETEMTATLGPTPNFTTLDRKIRSPSQVSLSHPTRELSPTGSASGRHSFSTAAHGSSDILRATTSSISPASSWTSESTAQHFSEPQHTQWVETSPSMEMERLPASTSVFTSPATGSMEATSVRELSTTMLTTETTSSPGAVYAMASTNIPIVRGYVTERRLATTHLPIGTTASSEISTDFTMAKESVSMDCWECGAFQQDPRLNS
ncbi:mucin-16-like [Saimiri boliviensis]|uniref:mucin-16-like n=1 Tax=Saimiri boliviensis TaxID=27679 RepID=UPI003D77583E